MQIEKLVLLLACLMISGLGAAAESDSKQPKSENVDKQKIPAALIESMETTAPAGASGGTGSNAAPCKDRACLGVSESELKLEADLKAESELKAEKELKEREANGKKKPLEEGPVVSEPAKLALRKSQEWAENPRALPAEGKDGRMLFTFGDSAPTVICAPLRVCDIELEPGETVQGAPHIGDSVRWKIAPAVSVEGDQKVTHLIIKPTEAGLDTNLMVPTDRRTYHLRLVSSKDKYLARIAFEYPDNSIPIWQKMMQPSKTDRVAYSAPGVPRSDFPPVSVDRMNFNYKVEVVKGKPKFKPLRVMDDGVHTYISMNDDMPVEEAPVLVLVDPDDTEQMVNYRLKGNIFIVDRMIEKAALISGTGSNQQRVEIAREKKCVKQGWFGRCANGSE